MHDILAIGPSWVFRSFVKIPRKFAGVACQSIETNHCYENQPCQSKPYLVFGRHSARCLVIGFLHTNDSSENIRSEGSGAFEASLT